MEGRRCFGGRRREGIGKEAEARGEGGGGNRTYGWRGKSGGWAAYVVGDRCPALALGLSTDSVRTAHRCRHGLAALPPTPLVPPSCGLAARCPSRPAHCCTVARRCSLVRARCTTLLPLHLIIVASPPSRPLAARAPSLPSLPSNGHSPLRARSVCCTPPSPRCTPAPVRCTLPFCFAAHAGLVPSAAPLTLWPFPHPPSPSPRRA